MSIRPVLTTTHILLVTLLMAVATGCVPGAEAPDASLSPLASPTATLPASALPTSTPSPATPQLSVLPTATGPAAAPSPPPTEPAPRTGPRPTGQGSLAPELEKLVRLAMEDLARRRGVEVDDISLVSVKTDEFPAGSLGCPSPKEPPRPIPAFVSGQVIVLELRGLQFVYHASRNQVFFCGLR